MNILDKIVENKRIEVGIRKQLIPVSKLEKSLMFSSERPSFRSSITEKGPSIIGEFKRRSPSKGIINEFVDIEDVAIGYEKAGVRAMSILTDIEFFGGDENDLEKVAGISGLPLLRKDFIIDEYQVIESKSIGASAILLIAAILTKEELHSLNLLAGSLGLDVLHEIHSPVELDKLSPGVGIIGINNRNLNTFSVDIGHSQELIRQLPEACLKVAESGLSSYEEVKFLYEMGFDAFLIGENFMRSQDPGRAAEKFIKGLKQELK